MITYSAPVATDGNVRWGLAIWAAGMISDFEMTYPYFLPLLSSCPHTPFFLGMRNDIAFDDGYCIRFQPPQLLQTEQRIEPVIKVTVFEVGAANDARVAVELLVFAFFL